MRLEPVPHIAATKENARCAICNEDGTGSSETAALYHHRPTLSIESTTVVMTGSPFLYVVNAVCGAAVLSRTTSVIEYSSTVRPSAALISVNKRRQASRPI